MCSYSWEHVCLSSLNMKGCSPAHQRPHETQGNPAKHHMDILNAVLHGLQMHEVNINTDLETGTTCGAISLHSILSL